MRALARQSPHMAVPTRMPSLGAIVRLVGFTGVLRRLCKRLAHRFATRYSDKALALGYDVHVEVPAAVFSGRRRRKKLVGNADGNASAAASRPQPTPKCQIGRKRNVEVQGGYAKGREFHGRWRRLWI